jgi:hypothetical protein
MARGIRSLQAQTLQPHPIKNDVCIQINCLLTSAIANQHLTKSLSGSFRIAPPVRLYPDLARIVTSAVKSAASIKSN